MSHLKLAPVTVLPVITRLDLDAERVLQQAAEKLAEVVIVGYDHDGQFYFASNKADGGTVLWLLEKAKLQLLEAEIPEG